MTPSTKRTVLTTTAALLVFTTATFALYTNGGFEAGNFTGGWTKSTFLNFGLSGSQPFSGSNIVRTPGGSDRTAIVGGLGVTPLSVSDPIVAAAHYPRFGSYAARINYWPTGGTDPNRVANSLRQQAVVAASDVDASDGKVHARFVYLPILEDGGHTPAQQAYSYVVVRNVTKGTVVWERFTFANEAGVPWQTSGTFRYTDWQAVDVSGGPGVIDIGDTLELEAIASACALGGHRGHVYVDAFGSTIPGGSIVATAPPSTVPDAALTYGMHVSNGGTGTLASPVVSIVIPAQTTFASVSNAACSHASGVVTCNLPGLAAGASIDFDLVVTVASGATGTITLGNYSVAGTSYPALLGPTRTTAVNAPIGVADSYTTSRNTALVVSVPGILANDADPNGDALTAVLVTNVAHGTLTLNANGSFTYNPTNGYTGPDSFIYRARDASLTLSAATNVALTVLPNNTPAANADSYTTAEDTPLIVSAPGVLANDVDPNGDPVTATLVTGPAHGTLTLNADGSFTYAPAANYHGTDAFSYRASDDASHVSNVAVVSLSIGTVDDVPVAVNDVYPVVEDTPIAIAAPGILANDSDGDGQALTAVIEIEPANGTLTLNANGSFTYAPNPNFAGVDMFLYRASDGTLQSDTATVFLTVSAMNDAPTAAADAFTGGEDTLLTVAAPGLLANDADPDAGTILGAVLVSGPSHGVLTLNPNGSFTYQPAADYNGPDSFVYRASDGVLQSGDTSVTLSVTAVGDAPTANNDGPLAVDEDGSRSVPAPGVLGNDVDTEGDPLTAVLVSGPSHGTLTLNPDGGFVYTPTADYNGPDSFVYRASDGTLPSGDATVTLAVNPVADAPTATADGAFTIAEDGTLTVPAASGVLVNDSDADGDPLAAVLVSGPSHGTLTVNPEGSFLYTPAADYFGPDSFVYRASDGTLQSGDTVVTLNVTSVNDAPTAGNDGAGGTLAVDEDGTLTVPAPGVLGNDTDPETDPLTAVLVSSPSHGTLTLNPDGSFLYTPVADYNGPDSFVYRTSDGTAQSGDATVTLVVNPVADAPTATADGAGGAFTVAEDGTLTVPAASGVLVNDSDADGDSLTAVLVSGPSHGTLTLNPDGSFVYTPTADYFGPDSFVYRASDGTLQSGDTAVTLNVTSVNDAPTAGNDGAGGTLAVDEDGTLTVPAPGVLGNDTDPESDPLTTALVSGPSHGTLTLNADGSFVYTPAANYNGADSFVYRASDGTAQSGDATVTLTVNAVPDAPTATADGAGGSFTVAEDGSLTVPAISGVLANDSDVDGDPLTAVLVSGPSHGTLALNPDGSFVYTPAANYNGPDSFVYRASDGALQSGDTAVTLTVTPVEDLPTAVNDGAAVDEDATLAMPAPGVLANDGDLDGDPLTAVLVSGPSHGTLTLNPDGGFTYTPAANYNGADSFTYAANDGHQNSSPATVTLTVNPVNDPPTAVGNTYAVGRHQTLTVSALSGVLANDGDLDASSTLTAVLVTGPSHGTLTLNPDGGFTYDPDPSFTGTDTFTYLVSDGTASSTPVTASLVVGDDVTLSPGSGRDTGGVRVTIGGTVFGPAGTPVTVTLDGVPALEAEVLDDGHITFVTPPLPAGTPVDVVFALNGGTPETLPDAYLPLPVPAVGDPTDTDGDGITDEIELKYGLDPTNPDDADDDPDNDGVPSNTEITQGTHPNAPYLRYFAEGINNAVFNTGIAVANSSTATMEAQITFFRQGQAPVRKNLTLAGKTRLMLNTATVAGMADAAFGVEVAGNEAVSADRTTFWDLGGREAHSEHAVEASPTWYFAEGATTGRFSLFYLLTNPASVPANVTVTFLRQVGTPIVKQYVVPGYARVTIPVNTTDPGLASADLGGIVAADRPIVAERSMYLSSPTKIWEAGTGGTGVTAPANRWFFGEGATGSFFDAWILLSNPGSTDATVDVRYVADTGADVTRQHVVPAGRRITIRVVDEDPAMMNTSFATFVTSTNSVPVVAERAMWWRAEEGRWTAGHVGVGFTEGGRKWVTADGVAAADGSSDTYALVSNTESRPGLLKVTAVFDDGTAPVERQFAIGANQRFTIRGRQRFPEVVGKGYSLIIESIGATPVDIVVDHSTYFDLDGRFWAMGTTSPGSKIR